MAHVPDRKRHVLDRKNNGLRGERELFEAVPVCASSEDISAMKSVVCTGGTRSGRNPLRSGTRGVAVFYGQAHDKGLFFTMEHTKSPGFLRLGTWPAAGTGVGRESDRKWRSCGISSQDEAVGSPVLECAVEGDHLTLVNGGKRQQIGVSPDFW